MDSLPFQTVHVLETSQLAGERMDAHATERLRSLLRELAGCRMGQLLLRVAVEQRLVIRFVEGGELDSADGRAAGMYKASSRTLVIDDHARRPDQLATLAHELQHFVDAVRGWPICTVQSEVRAQQSEAQVIRQLGLRAGSWGITGSGVLVHPEAIADRVRAHPFYARYEEEPTPFDRRVHPLLDAHEVLPPLASCWSGGTGSSMAIGSVGAVAPVASTTPVAMVATGGVTQAATAALGAARPTGFDPEPAFVDSSAAGRFLDALDAHRLVTGA